MSLYHPTSLVLGIGTLAIEFLSQCRHFGAGRAVHSVARRRPLSSIRVMDRAKELLDYAGADEYYYLRAVYLSVLGSLVIMYNRVNKH